MSISAARSLPIIIGMLFYSASAGIGIGGCPAGYPVTDAYNIEDGTYYLNFYDRAFWSIETLFYRPLELVNPNLSRLDCQQA